MENLQVQYAYIQSSRTAVLDHLKSIKPEQLTTPIAAFNDKSIMYMAVHVCNVYVHWIGNFALKKAHAYFNEDDFSTIDQLESAHDTVDGIMETFFNAFKGKLNQELTAQINGRMVTATALKVFTHVCTHEFHHKGQMMSMSRLLGNYPPDTDVIRS